MTSRPVLEVEKLSKSFGDARVLDNLTFSVPEGVILGFVGENGAGKTTTMKIALGLLPADSGTVRICGKKVTFGQTSTNKHVGYLPDVPEFYGYMRPQEYLRLCGEISGVKRSALDARIREMLHLVGLTNDKKIGGFSRGMKQRLGIAQALLNKPKLLICDEPTSALDPVGRSEVLDVLQKVKDRTTVVFSTHILSDVEKVCDQVAILHKGSIARQGTLSELKSGHNDRLRIDFAGAKAKEVFTRATAFKYQDVEVNSIVISADDMPKAYNAVLKTIEKENVIANKIEIVKPTIEDIFFEVVR